MDYEIKLLHFDDNGFSLQQVADLQHIVYADRGGGPNAERLKFWYLDNPMGPAVSFNAFAGDQLVAHYACVPVKMLIDGKISSGLMDMATVTHPDHRGKGLFKTLASTTFDHVKQMGYEFVVGVANANSFPGYMKYFPFTFVGQLDVKWGWGDIILPEKTFSGYWDADALKWRFSKQAYTRWNNAVYGPYENYPIIKTYMGNFSSELLNNTDIHTDKQCAKPLNLYVGMGADLSKGHYFDFPKFVKHSPFNLIFLDLTDGKLPQVNNNNIIYQLIDFDAA